MGSFALWSFHGSATGAKRTMSSPAAASRRSSEMGSLKGSVRLLGAGLAVMILASAGHAQPSNAQSSNMQSLHDALHLSATQEIAWHTFQAAMAEDPSQAARQRSAAVLMPTLTAPRRVDLSIALMEGDLQTLRRRGNALKTFYATLSPEQQGVFDKQTSPPTQ
jgi:hypothetical protein